MRNVTGMVECIKEIWMKFHSTGIYKKGFVKKVFVKRISV